VATNRPFSRKARACSVRARSPSTRPASTGPISTPTSLQRRPSDGLAYTRPMAEVLSVRGLRKQYGATVAVDGVSFAVGAREIVGLLGPNGAGKTTTINMVLGVLEPTGGAIEIEGIDVSAQRSRALERTNFAAVYAPLPGNLTVAQNL